jgi:hypothetical protein
VADKQWAGETLSLTVCASRTGGTIADLLQSLQYHLTRPLLHEGQVAQHPVRRALLLRLLHSEVLLGLSLVSAECCRSPEGQPDCKVKWAHVASRGHYTGHSNNLHEVALIFTVTIRLMPHSSAIIDYHWCVNRR